MSTPLSGRINNGFLPAITMAAIAIFTLSAGTSASSLIISDNGFSRETGKDTDFIVVTH
jgi:hypothetical protein